MYKQSHVRQKEGEVMAHISSNQQLSHKQKMLPFTWKLNKNHDLFKEAHYEVNCAILKYVIFVFCIVQFITQHFCHRMGIHAGKKFWYQKYGTSLTITFYIDITLK